jgi:FkbM family methyltransferase
MAKRLRLGLARAARNHDSFRGRDRVLRFTDSLLRKWNSAPLDIDVSGVRFCLDTADLIDFRLAYCGAHQSVLMGYIASRVQDRSLSIWDVGANVGSISLPLAAWNSAVSIYAFEPSPPVFTRLLGNLKRNPALLSRIHPRQEALSDISGSVPFFVSNEAFNSGVGGLGPSLNRAATPVEVITRRGDDLIQSGAVPAPSLIKIDVEGFELEVLRGLERFLTESREVEIIFENEPYRLRERNFRKTAVVEYLAKFGFEIREIAYDKQGQTRPFQESSLDRTCDLIARKSSV